MKTYKEQPMSEAEIVEEAREREKEEERKWANLDFKKY